MKIRKINVKNFRNLRDFEIYPYHSTTVFIGENNSGKSNLLYALRLLLSPRSKRLEPQLSEEDINDFARSEGENFFSVSVEIGALQEHQELEAVFRDRIGRDNGETYVTIEGRYELDENGDYTWKSQVLSPPKRDNEPIAFRYRMAKHVPLFFLGPVRDAGREMRATGGGTLSELLGEVNLEDVEEDVIEKLSEANEMLSQCQDISSLEGGIAGLLNSLLPSGRGEVSMAVANEDPSQLVKEIRLNLRRQSDYREYDIYRHGTGLQNLVLMAMFRHKISLSTEEGIQPIFAIEEPEAHLHPQSQRCLFKDLEEISGPVLLTTHSPTIVESCDPLSLVRMSTSEENVATSQQLNPSTIDQEDIKSLKRMMRAGRADAFFARSIIIVEGQSEAITLPVFAKRSGYNLDRDGITIVPAYGNAFSYILSSCEEEQFSIPTVVLFDTDALVGSNNLVNEAYKSGLVNEDVWDSCKSATAETRQKKLKDIGWIPVTPNFEAEVARAGCLDLIREKVDDWGYMRSLTDFLESSNLEMNPNGVAQYLNNSRRGKGLKVPIARAIANNADEIGYVPTCFERAFEKASELAG